MATSQNGWTAIASGSSPALTNLSFITGKVRAGDVHAIFDDLCRRFDADVEPITRAHSWGYAYRDIRGSSTNLSNHASGTAIDLNAPKHPLGAAGTFTPAQVRSIKAILARYDGVIRWGGAYSGRKDEMHFEIVASAATVARVADQLRGGTVKPAASKPAKTTATPASSSTAPLKEGSRGERVKKLQRGLNRAFPAYSKLAVDGDFGAKTTAVVRQFQRRSGLVADGVIGPKTLAALKKNGVL